MAPFRNAEVVPLSEVPSPEVTEAPEEAVKSDKNAATEPVVLVVDDEPLVADTLAAILSHAGYTALVAYCGRRALELLRSVTPALVISDFAMPHMNGIELAMAVLQQVPHCGILLFSGHATMQDLAPARAAGHTFTLLTKPLHPEEMLRHVSKNLGRSDRARTPFHLHSIDTSDLLAETA